MSRASSAKATDNHDKFRECLEKARSMLIKARFYANAMKREDLVKTFSEELAVVKTKLNALIALIYNAWNKTM
jgi:hypothetical protein